MYDSASDGVYPLYVTRMLALIFNIYTILEGFTLQSGSESKTILLPYSSLHIVYSLLLMHFSIHSSL
nr:MAG TPA: hypothetical protein [Bacteriophage sp.]